MDTGNARPDGEKRLVVDRFEGEMAVCQDPETRAMEDVPRAMLPEGTREGDVLVADGEGYRLDGDEAERRRKRIARKMEDLWE